MSSSLFAIIESDGAARPAEQLRKLLARRGREVITARSTLGPDFGLPWDAVVVVVLVPDDLSGTASSMAALRHEIDAGKRPPSRCYVAAELGTETHAVAPPPRVPILAFGPPPAPDISDVAEILARTPSAKEAVGQVFSGPAALSAAIRRRMTPTFMEIYFAFVALAVWVAIASALRSSSSRSLSVEFLATVSGPLIVVLVLLILSRRDQRTARGELARLDSDLRAEFDAQRRALTETSDRLRTFSDAPALQRSSRTRDADVGAAIATTKDNTALVEVLGELHHALGTPLAQIDATAQLMIGTSAETDARLVGASVNLCWAFLDAFRHVADALPTSRLTDPLGITLSEASDLYSKAFNRSPTISITMPESIPGYPNAYVLACVLPILENAVEAAADGSLVTVRQRTFPDSTLVDIASRPQRLPPAGPEIYRRGVSFREGAHRGLGLATVKRLLSAYDRAGVSHVIDADTVIFTVSFPMRSEQH